MNGKKYQERVIETDTLNREVLVHTAMYYQCVCCGRIYRFWLEKGLEDRMQDAIDPGGHKPVPYCVGCLCGGTARHVAWEKDVRLDKYELLGEDMNYFENSEDSDCGIPHFRNYGEEEKKEDSPEDQYAAFEELKSRLTDAGEDDPYGLANVSTSRLKAELRRRKRW